MPALPRKTQLVFGSGLSPTGNVAKYGSLAAGAPAYASTIQALEEIQTARWLQGFNGAVVGNRSPAQEDLNGALLVVTQQLAYLLQSGVPEWDAGTTYFTDNIVRVGVILYASLTDNNIAHDPTSDTNNWVPFLAKTKGSSICVAWAVFDGINSTGGNSRLIDSFNVDHIVMNALGSYTLHFGSALPTQNYTLTGSCGSEDGQPYGAGDDGVVVGNVASQGNAVRSTTACRFFTINPSTKVLTASGCTSVQFFVNP